MGGETKLQNFEGLMRPETIANWYSTSKLSNFVSLFLSFKIKNNLSHCRLIYKSVYLGLDNIHCRLGILKTVKLLRQAAPSPRRKNSQKLRILESNSNRTITYQTEPYIPKKQWLKISNDGIVSLCCASHDSRIGCKP